MKKTIAPGVWLFLDDDDAFIRCCQERPTGYFWNCRRTATGEILRVDTLHRALREGDLCPHFKDDRTGTGYSANLTKGKRCKVFSTDHKALDLALGSYRGKFSECADCMK